ncbi:MAG TPA: glycerol-3-phosphate acyltransferase [Anaerolineales bacterium]|nr:glycerol-3-phosphate acyltransferase [Anaerolineales bacterium]
MQIGIGIVILFVSYLIGSIPFGLIIVKLITGEDVRTVESGRTGGTNAMRAAGFLAGATTAAMDVLKSAIGVWLARWLVPDMVWIIVLAPVMAIIGHNYSIFLMERDEQGRLRLRGGAGGAPSVGGSFALWPPVLLIILPVAGFILYFVGYASVATMSAPIITIIVFAVMAWAGKLPWQYIVYGVLAELLLLYALRPNIKRLLNGTERLIGRRAKKQAQVAKQQKS